MSYLSMVCTGGTNTVFGIELPSRVVEYRRATDPAPLPLAAFSLLKSDASGYRAFDPVRTGLTVAGMMRHAAVQGTRQAGWDEAEIASLVLGHGESQGANAHIPVGPHRFAYLPLPSIQVRGKGGDEHVGAIRRVLVTSFSRACSRRVAQLRRILAGQDLFDKSTGEVKALLSLVPTTEKMVRRYVSSSATWSTVTPVCFPGHDDPRQYRRRLNRGVDAQEQKRLLSRLDTRADALIRKAIVQAGYSEELAKNASIEMRNTGFMAGVSRADRCGVPNHLSRFPRKHVRIRWFDRNGNPVRVSGPVCLGAWRFLGLGLFVPEDLRLSCIESG